MHGLCNLSLWSLSFLTNLGHGKCTLFATFLLLLLLTNSCYSTLSLLNLVECLDDVLCAVQSSHQALEDLLLGHYSLGTSTNLVCQILVLTLEKFKGIDEFFLLSRGQSAVGCSNDGRCDSSALSKSCTCLLLQCLHLGLMLVHDDLEIGLQFLLLFRQFRHLLLDEGAQFFVFSLRCRELRLKRL